MCEGVTCEDVMCEGEVVMCAGVMCEGVISICTLGEVMSAPSTVNKWDTPSGVQIPMTTTPSSDITE